VWLDHVGGRLLSFVHARTSFLFPATPPSPSHHHHPIPSSSASLIPITLIYFLFRSLAVLSFFHIIIYKALLRNLVRIVKGEKLDNGSTVPWIHYSHYDHALSTPP
jgi:hypothetical protein